MQNLLVISSDLNRFEQFLSDYAKKQRLKPANIYQFGLDQPLSVEEFRQILKLEERHFVNPTLFVLHRFHQTSGIIQNTFLKTLEEHQTNLGFMLVAGNQGLILPTIKSRCDIVTLRLPETKPLTPDYQQMEQTVSQLREQPGCLLSNLIKLGLKDKKEKALVWLDLFLKYGYFQLASASDPLWLGRCLKQALINRNLIEINNLEPELALDQVFLS